MATYILPQALVHQEFAIAATAQVEPRPAHIAGGHAALTRYEDEDEKEDGLFGFYDPIADGSYPWPSRPAGGVVDYSYTKVFIEDALLRYFYDATASGALTTAVGADYNRIKSPTLVFVETPGHSRSAVFGNRDVQIGDVVLARTEVDGDEHSLLTYVAGFDTEVDAAVIDDASSDEDNQDTQTLDGSYSKTAGEDNCVVLDTLDVGSYDGLADGDVSEVYTVEVIQASVGGDATTARFRVTSASGNDDVASVAPQAFGVATAIGTRGVLATWDLDPGPDCSVSAVDEDLSPEDFVVGQTWEIVVDQAFTAPSDVASGGTYDGEIDDTYIIEVTRGGPGSVDPEEAAQIMVRTARGSDLSGPHYFSGTGIAIPIGTHGVTLTFTGTHLCKGDRYYIEVFAASEGATRTLILGHNFSEDVIAEVSVEVELSLYIRKTIEVPAIRTNASPLTNWEQSETELILKSGITAFDDSWTDDDGEPEALPVHSEGGYGKVYIESRYWLSTLCSEVNGIFDVATLDDSISGPLHPDNPLKWGVYKALQNSAGRKVTYTSVCNPNDTDSWLTVLELLDGRIDTYGLVPLTRDKVVWGAYQAHVNAQSSPEIGRRRVAWFNAEAIDSLAVVTSETSSDEEEVLAAIEDDPNTSGTQYTRLRVTTGNANFVVNGVLPGDKVRISFQTIDGEETYDEYEIDAVLNESTLRLISGPDAAISTSEKIEVWRSLSATQQSAELAKTWGFSDRRIMMIWPDEVESDGYSTPGYFLCAALAGLVSGVLPHQGLTRLSVAGFSNMDRTTKLFNRSQLDTMAGGGMWIVTQDPSSGAIYSRHAVTTADYEEIAEREEMITRNFDAVASFFQTLYDPYIGIANVTPSFGAILQSETRAGIKFLESAGYTARLGSMVIEGRLIELRPHATLKDRYVVGVDLILPFPANNIECHLRLVA